jgi:hypothetical protein
MMYSPTRYNHQAHCPVNQTVGGLRHETEDDNTLFVTTIHVERTCFPTSQAGGRPEGGYL